MLSLEMIWEARQALEGVARVTPLTPTKNLGKICLLRLLQFRNERLFYSFGKQNSK